MTDTVIRLSMIAAIGKNRELGRENRLLWDIPKDMQHFRETTRGHAVIMGRKTFESIGRPLPNRKNIVVTRDMDFPLPEGVVRAVTFEQALVEAKKHETEEVFVIGGAQIYALAMPYADKLYLTIVDKEYPDADAFFPSYENDFKKIVSSKGEEENGYKFTFLELER